MNAALNKRRSNSTLRQHTSNPPTSVDFSSNDFLSLSSLPDLRNAFIDELARHPNFTLGSGGSRLLDGNSTYAEDLETSIAAFHNAPTGLLCNSGFDANVGIFSCLPQPGDIIIYDEYIHASVHDGMRASRASKLLSFAHNNVDSFTAVLQSTISSDPLVRNSDRNVFIALEAIYSMDGDICPLASLEAVVTKLLPHGNGHLILDEAHSTGFLGSQGRGLVSSLHLESRILVRLHTFGKALSSTGAVILCSDTVKQYLINYARPLIYTTFMTFPNLASIKASYSLLMDGTTDVLARRLEGHIRLFHGLLLELQATLTADARERKVLKIADECPLSPIFSVETNAPRVLAKWCQDGGFIVRPIMPPTVPVGAERVRVCLHAGNTEKEVRALAARIGEWCLAQTGQAVTGQPKL
ncbi:hypothetical protein MBLNU457_g2736t1 [Dothideomycetes sp. NU457]